MQIYVACLAAYNNDLLHGEWIDATQSVEDMQFDIDEMLSKSPIKDAEEWAIHDYDGMVNLGEYAPLDDIAGTAELIEEYGYFATKYASDNEGGDPESAREYLEDKYLGKYEVELFGGEIDALMRWYEETDQFPQDELPEWAQNHYDAIMRDKAQDEFNGGAYHLEYEGMGVYHLFSN